MPKTPTERTSKLSVVMVFAVCSMVCPDFASARTQEPRKELPLSASARARIRKAIASVGQILVKNFGEPAGQPPRPRGSAVVVRADGVVVTNAHVIFDSKTGRLYDEILLSLAADGSHQAKRYRLKALMANRDDDLALLRVELGAPLSSSARRAIFPAIEIGDSNSIGLLDDIVIIGYPEKGGSSVTVNRGTVEGKDALGRWIKTDARLIHGNSGGAAVSLDGKLIGIPTKVIADDQRIDKNGDGLPDSYRRYGGVGFLRPADMVSSMLAGTSGESSPIAAPIKPSKSVDPPPVTLVIMGLVRSADGQPIAGAVVGFVRAGEEVKEENLLSWGSTNHDGKFKLNNPIPPGRYTLRAKALGYLPYSRDIEMRGSAPELLIEMRASSGR
jgi:S1-C subfamily serine protease